MNINLITDFYLFFTLVTALKISLNNFGYINPEIKVKNSLLCYFVHWEIIAYETCTWFTEIL